MPQLRKGPDVAKSVAASQTPHTMRHVKHLSSASNLLAIMLLRVLLTLHHAAATFLEQATWSILGKPSHASSALLQRP